jgi:hypothetical protein
VIEYIEAELSKKEKERDAIIASEQAKHDDVVARRNKVIAKVAAQIRGVDLTLSDEKLVEAAIDPDNRFIPSMPKFDKAEHILYLENRQWLTDYERDGQNFSIVFLRRAKKAVSLLTDPDLTMTDLKDLGLKGLIP